MVTQGLSMHVNECLSLSLLARLRHLPRVQLHSSGSQGYVDKDIRKYCSAHDLVHGCVRVSVRTCVRRIAAWDESGTPDDWRPRYGLLPHFLLSSAIPSSPTSSPPIHSQLPLSRPHFITTWHGRKLSL
ncbi:unnamed protein product [Pleuronectes platessa]|uniref:Uncharacterized protein n=1 Tax=Pleuronectes platessa TaxID=8262 RepID=A0A9N7YWY9_PLEPL|nr:unnamed protein product [Pleuronectes platessa]